MTTEYSKIAEAADEILRESGDTTYEILLGEYEDGGQFYCIAAPRDDSEGGDPFQPTSVFVGWAYEFESAEELHDEAMAHTDTVDEFAMAY